MLRHSKSLLGWHLHAADGQVGKLYEFYFDDATWQVRYLVVNTGSWLSQRLVLLSPVAVTAISTERREIQVALTRDQVRLSPDIDVDKPVSRQEEAKLHTHYAWPVYWATSNPLEPEQAIDHLEVTDYAPTRSAADDHANPHLRSSREVTTYRLHTRNDFIGHVVDIVFDDATWTIRYLEADTGNWLPGKHTLLLPETIRHISWHEASIELNFDTDHLRHAPPYERQVPIDRDLEQRLIDYYHGQPATRD